MPCGQLPFLQKKNDRGLCLILCYVDDNLSAASSMELLDEVINEVKSHGYVLTITDDLSDYLSCEVKVNPDKTKMWIGQPHMVKKITLEFGDEVKSGTKCKTPGTPGICLMKAVDDIEKKGWTRRSTAGTGLELECFCIWSSIQGHIWQMLLGNYPSDRRVPQ